MDDINSALIATADYEKLSPEQIAVAAEAGFASVRDWLAHKSTPGGDRLLRLMRAYPNFAERLGFRAMSDRSAVA